MEKADCQGQKNGRAGKMFWIDQPNEVSRFPGDRPMVTVLVTFHGGWSSDRRTLWDYRKALLDAVAHVDQLIEDGKS